MKNLIAFLVGVFIVTGTYKVGAYHGFKTGYKAALPVGAFYGARSLATYLAIPIDINCPVVPPELVPDKEASAMNLVPRPGYVLVPTKRPDSK